MDRLERLVVQVEEAIRLAETGEVARLRLALLLLDSAAELMLHREVSYILEFEASPDLLRWLETREDLGHELSSSERQTRDRLRARMLTPRRRREVERVFDAKAQFLQTVGLLRGPDVRVLSRLHKYRNETYHRDGIRPCTLASAVRIYIYLVCTMMRDLPVHYMSFSGSAPPGLRPYLHLGEDAPFGLPMDLQAQIARQMLDQTNLSGHLEISQVLAEHLLDRIAQLGELLEFAADYLSNIRNDGPWNSDDVLKLVQIEDDRVAAFASRDEVQAMHSIVTGSVIASWRSAAELIACQRDQMSAFEEFADVEDAFEPIEAKVKESVSEIEAEIWLQFDIARGKLQRISNSYH